MNMFIIVLLDLCSRVALETFERQKWEMKREIVSKRILVANRLILGALTTEFVF